MFSIDDDHSLEVPAMNEDFDEKVQQAQEQLLKLRHQQEQVEKQKVELEELGAQQDKFTDGRAAISERLNTAIATLDREAQEAERRAEEFLQTKESFARHLDRISLFNPEQWARTDLGGELTRALSTIEDAECDYKNSMKRIGGLLERNSESASLLSAANGPIGFKAFLLGGLAFTLPLMVFSLIALVLYFLLG
ncbi:MAG: hypothetical protein AAGD22_00410 [Verrucomicrobiota bacterium]